VYIGLDLGTSGVKAVLFSPDGLELRRSARTYPLTGKGERLELSPADVFNAVIAVLGEIAAGGKEIRGIGLSSLGEACVFLDKKGALLRDTILPGDRRGAEYAEREAEKNRDYRIETLTGAPVNSTYTLFKLLWVKNHEPEIYEKLDRVMLYGDYIAWRLTGGRGISHSLASRTLAFDVRRGIFSDEILGPHGIDRGLFSSPVPGDAPVGRLLPEIAAATGLDGAVKVYAGGHDQVCAALGSGCVEAGQAADSMGSSECITPVLGALAGSGLPLEPAFIRRTNFPLEPFIIPGTYNSMAYTHTAGRLLEWYVKDILKRSSYAELDRSCGSGPTGLMILPHFAGAGTPTMDHRSVGAIVGLNIHTKDTDIYQALMENINYEMKQNLELLKGNGIPVREITASGGGARSPVWLANKANIFGIPVRTLQCPEAAAMGAAIAAARGDAFFSSFREAVQAMVRIKGCHEPDAAMVRLYREPYQRYTALYAGIRKITRKEQAYG
jgi:xylulokinase